MLGLATLPASASHPSLRRMRIAGVAIVFALVAVLASAGSTHAWAAGTFSAADEQLLFTLTNQDRASAGLNALVDDGYLHSKARWRAKDMADRNYFSHAIPPDGRMVFDYMQADGYCFQVAGENIGLTTFGDSDATTTLEQAFMGSPEHRDNILGTWADMGVGAYQGPDGRKLYSVLFSIPCGVVAPTPTPVPTPVATAVPTPVATPVPTPVPTPVSTPRSVATVRSTATPPARAGSTTSAGPSLTPSFTPTATPQPLDTSASATTTAAPSATTYGKDAGSTSSPGTATSLRVHEKSTSGGPIDSFLNSLFGGLFGL
jgi:uncharacterized protein YkwD